MKLLLLFIFMLSSLTGCFNKAEEAAQDSLVSGHKKVENAFEISTTLSKVYMINEKITFNAKHPFTVIVSGSPYISIDINGASKRAYYSSGSGSKNILFEYTIAAGDNDTDGIEIGDQIELNGGSIDFSNKGIASAATVSFKSISGDSIHIDTIAPSITNIETSANVTYKEGDKIRASATFSEKVFVSGIPRLKIIIGSQTRLADYVSGNKSKVLNFEYIVLASDLDSDGIVLDSPLALNGGSITDSNNLISSLSFTGTTAPNTALVDGALTYVNSVTKPIGKTYKPGEAIDIVVEFSKNVTVSGSPQIPFLLGSSAKFAGYHSGSGSNSLTFRYIVISGDEDIDGVLFTPIISLNSGTIIDGNLRAAELSFVPILTTDVLVDASIPKVINITPPSNSSYNSGKELLFTFEFNKQVDVVGIPRINIQIDSNGVNPNWASYVSGSGTNALIFRYVVQAIEADADGITLIDGIDLNGSQIKDSNLTNADLSFATVLASLNTNGVIIDNNMVEITGVTAPSGQDYQTGQNIDFTVRFNQNVDVTNTPRLALTIGSSSVFADYLSGSASSDLVFRYTVLAADSDTDGILLSSNIIDLNSSGTIKKAGNSADAPLDFTAFTPNLSAVLVNSITPTVSVSSPASNSYINATSDSSTFAINGNCNVSGQVVTIEINGSSASGAAGFICNGATYSGTINTTTLAEGVLTLVANIQTIGGTSASSANINLTKDITSSSVSSITIPANKTYIATEQISFTVNTNEIVNVSGSPRLELTVGSSSRFANYISGSGSNALLFRYDVTSGDEDTDGLAITNLIDLNSGTLADNAGNPLNLDLTANAPIGDTSLLLVDAIIPVVAITTAGDISNANKLAYVVIGTCSENGQNVSLSIGSLSWAPPCIGGAWTSGNIDVSSLGDTPALSITADLSDTAGNTALSASINVIKNTATPTVTINSASNIDNSNKTSYSLSGTCTEEGRVVSVDIGGISYTPNCSSGTWSLSNEDVSSLSDSASISITADHTDGSTPAPQATATISKDTVSATVTISLSPSISANNELAYLVTGTCSVASQPVSIDIGSVNISKTCNSGAWSSASVDVSSLTDGAVTITVNHEGSQATKIISKNTSTPTIASLSAPSTLKNSIDLVWTVNEPAGFTINDYEINYRVKGTPTWLAFNDGVSTAKLTTITSLNASTTYESRVRVKYNTSLYSDWSSITEALTKPDNPLFDGPNKAMNVAGATDSKVVAYYDTTRVFLNGTEIPESPLSKGQSVQFASAQFDIIDADKPIYTAGRRGSGSNTAKANITWMPTVWAGRNFTLNSIRDNPQQLHIYAIENATITVKQGGTTVATGSATAGSGTVISWSVYGSYQINSTGTILAFHTSGNPSSRLVDPKPLLPASLEIIGFPSNSMRLTTQKDGTNYSFLHSNSTAASNVISKSDSIQINPQATGAGSSLYRSNSLLISSDQGISGASYADSNGNCAAPFLPTNFMKKKYMINSNSNWVAFASKSAGTIQVLDSSDNVVQTLTLTRSGANAQAPYYVRIGTTSGGTRFVSTTPVAAWYEPNSDAGSAIQDETILYGFSD